MKVENVKVYDLEESIIASGYPMRVDLNGVEKDVEMLEQYITEEYLVGDEKEKCEKHMKRISNLALSGGTSGHTQALTGIRVAFDLTFTNKAWVEMERYRFIEFVSSQSTMHRISKMDIKRQVNEYVTENTIQEVERLKDIYLQTQNKEDYLRLLYNIPSGFELTARLTTNYRALRTVYHQRKNHRLPEWREFCEWIRGLPYSKELITGDTNDSLTK